LTDYSEALSRAALAFGIEPEYTDIWGRRHATPDDVARAILGSLGVNDAAGAVDRRRTEEWSRPLAPAIVVGQDAESIRLNIPEDRAGASVKLEIQWESGEVEHHWFWLPELPELERARMGEREFIAKRVPLPHPLRLGYHHLKIYSMKEPGLETLGEARFIVCPARAKAADRRMAGVAVSLYGLRSRRNWGVGDFTDLRAMIDQLAPAGVQFLALNPLHAIPNRQPYNTSPYLPQSSLYRNFIYLDVDKIGESHADPAEIQALRDSEFVEYERVARLKLAALKEIFDRFSGSVEFDRLVEAEGAPLHDFAVYCALDEEMHRRNPNVWLWTDWPVEYRDPASPEVARFAKEQERSVLFFKFLQWHIDRQLAEAQAYATGKGMRVGLYHDLALATDRWGADLWANSRFYVAGCRVGSPPDDFSPNGQDWAFPPPNRDAHRANGYELFAQAIRKNARHGGALRIDHVMRFFRLYWIPDGMPASNGAYVLDYHRDLLGILALESVRGNFLVIGEDLGTVTGEVRQALSEAGILSYRVFWFEKHPDGSFRRPDEYPAHAAVSTTTHDLPTLAGFAAARDIEARRAAGLIDDAGYRDQLATRHQEQAKLARALRDAGFENDPLGFLLSTPCALAIVNQEDLTGETEQQNLPGSTWQNPNWRRKMKVAVEDLGPLAENLRAKIARSGRK
jgi:4-alpha-glucanotransferase